MGGQHGRSSGRKAADGPMKLWRRIVGLAALTAMGVVLGAAASLSLSSDTVGAATTATPRCTAAGLSVFQNLSASTVVSVTVGVLPAACAGATLQVTVNNGVANASGSAAVPGGGGSVVVTLGSAPAVTATEQTDLVVVGP
jgi:hypothetical protein